MRKPKTHSERIIEALRSGEELGSPELVEKVSALLGKKVIIQDIASLLSRMTNPKKCDLAFFINKERKGGKYVYRLVKEALALTSEQAYGLYRKTGKERYPLDQAVKDYPAMEKYVPPKRLEQLKLAASTQKAQKVGKRLKKPASRKPIELTANLVSQIVTEIINRGGLKVDININLHIK